MSIPPYHPSQPEERIPSFNLLTIQDEQLDHPNPEEVLPRPADGDLPPVILGCAPFGYGIYADDKDVKSSLPLRLVRLALRSGITAFDTSPYYHPSELILGQALRALSPEFPRESYKIITKAGKYGPKQEHHIYDPAVITQSVERSLKRLGTDYLDVVYLHDVEYVTSNPPIPAGHHLPLLPSILATTPKSLGEGDLSVLSSLQALRDLQQVGKIKKIGIAGYPLPVLLRLARLAAANNPPIKIDIIQTYAHQTILTPTLSQGYLKAFNDAGVGQVVNAAPLAMGILTSGGGPAWHPAKSVLDGSITDATKKAAAYTQERGISLEKVAAKFGFKTVKQDDDKVVPVVIGCTTLEQIHQTLGSYKEANGVAKDEVEVEEGVSGLFKELGVEGISWQVPTPADVEG